MMTSEKKRRHRRNLRTRVWERDKGVCQLCFATIEGIHAMTLDHIVPRSKGGKATFANLRAAHNQCNMRRGNKELPFDVSRNRRVSPIDHRDPMTVTILDRFEAVRDPWDEDFGLSANNTLVRMVKK